MARKAVSNTEAFAYAPIVKFEELDNGNLYVYGKATDDTLDSDEQICDPSWLKTAMPQWFKFGNIREQHSSIAAGVAVEYEHIEGDGHYIGVEVVDVNSQKKVKAKVLKGFSIGIRRPRIVKDNKAAGGRIVDGEIVEISLVDRPANPSAVLTVAKTVDSGSLIQVEEFVKGLEVDSEPIVEEAAKSDAVAELAKSLSEVTAQKFDEAAYRDARGALARLIADEAQEFGEGHDERHSLWALLAAVNSLLDWFNGEALEGEVMEMESVAMAAEPEVAKCLECGCHMPAENHGRSDVTTAEIITAEVNDKADGEIELAKDAAPDDNSDIKSLVTDLVKSLLANESGEVTKATDASEERIAALEAELDRVKSLAVAGGPSRLGAASSRSAADEVTVRARLLLAKADSTQDKTLADGYRLLAKDLLKSAKADS